jgi:hypothetical protein
MRLPYRFTGYARQMTGNRFEGANRPDFSDAVTLAQIKDSVASHMQKLHVTDTRKYRYVRYVDEKGFRAMVGELAFFDENGRKIAGHPIGATDRYWYQPKDRAFDDDIVTFYEAADKESWIGLDLGEAGVSILSVFRHALPETKWILATRTRCIIGTADGRKSAQKRPIHMK